jgi:hypothetical protein
MATFDANPLGKPGYAELTTELTGR